MVRRGQWHYLITSRGDYGDCRYRTIWRRSHSLKRDWQGTRGHALLNRRNTGVCGPGGADYVPETDTAANRMFFHGWVCKGTNLPCYQSYQGHQDYEDVGKRALYAVRLAWTKDGPSISAFVQGPVPPPPVDRDADAHPDADSRAHRDADADADADADRHGHPDADRADDHRHSLSRLGPGGGGVRQPRPCGSSQTSGSGPCGTMPVGFTSVCTT